jgi:regulator of nucleoside diphosphate kinase
MAQTIYIAAGQEARLRDIIDQNREGRDGPTAELLADELDRAVILEDARVPPDVVTIGARVRYEDERSGSLRDVVLAYPSEADASHGRVSVLAPIGAALLGLRVGDVIEWPLPRGRSARIRIREVAPPDAELRCAGA